MTELEHIKCDIEDRILTITLNRPEKLNAFTGTMQKELIETFKQADLNDDVRVIIVTGAGRGFCAGADLSAGESTFDRSARAESVGIENRRDGGGQVSLAVYDLRTPLHLAAAEGRAHVVQFFIEQMQNQEARIDLNPQDRWGGTPLNDAYNHEHAHVIDMLEQAGGVRGNNGLPTMGRPLMPAPVLQADSAATTELIWAASAGDLRALRRLVARGIPLGVADYDLRTPLHLASAEGHLQVVEYLIAHKVNVNPLDRWGHTPLDDALRHGRTEVADLLKGEGGRRGQEAGAAQGKAADAT